MAIFGTSSAAWRYSRRVPMDIRRLAPVFACAVVFSALGAPCSRVCCPQTSSPRIAGLAGRRRPVRRSQPALRLPRDDWEVAPVDHSPGLAICGVASGLRRSARPGTGTFLIITLTALVGTSFLESSAMAASSTPELTQRARGVRGAGERDVAPRTGTGRQVAARTGFAHGARAGELVRAVGAARRRRRDGQQLGRMQSK